jgi:hypothetical protein
LSAAAKCAHPYLRRGNLAAVDVHEGRRGGWIGDVVFRNLPLGLANVLGTPVDSPCRTREEAVSQAVSIMASVLLAPDVELPAEPMAVIEFWDVSFNLPCELMALVDEAAKHNEVDTGYALRRLEEMTEVYFPQREGVEAVFKALPYDDQRMVMSVLLLASRYGVLRFPPREARAPQPDKEAGSVQ